MRARSSPSPRSNASATSRSGSTTCSGRLKSARDTRLTIPTFIPIARARVNTAAMTGPRSRIWVFRVVSWKVPRRQEGPGGRTEAGLLFSRLFEVGVALEPFLVELQEPLGFLVSDAAFAHGQLDVAAQLADQDLRVELDVIE